MKALEGMFNSKKFWYTIAAVVVPVISKKLGVEPEIVTQIFYAIIALIGGQALADFGKEGKKTN